MYRIRVNEQHNFNISRQNGAVLADGNPVAADAKKTDSSNWHIIKDFKSYNIEIIDFDLSEKTANIKVNGNLYGVTAKDQYDLLLEELGLNNLTGAKVSEIKAPMPGLVLKVFVTEGMAVSKGENLFVLEAMKMENIIKSSSDVIVKSVKIKPGDKVEKNQVLMMF